MKKFATKVTTVVLAIVLIVTAIPMEAFAATGSSTTYLEIVEDNAPIRTSKSGAKNNNIIERLPKGTIIECTGSSRNWVGQKWYHVKHSDYSGVIYSGNVKTHNHKYIDSVSCEGVTYNVCACGYIGVTYLEREITYNRSITAVLPTVSIPAGVAVASDGPLPLGDMIGFGILAVGSIYAMTHGVPTVSELKEMTMSLSDYFKEHSRSCSDLDFRTVKRENGLLYYTSTRCLNFAEAYVVVRYTGQDVYTKYETTAKYLANIHGGNFAERDKNRGDYYYHYHLIAENNAVSVNGNRSVETENGKRGIVGGHIFYGHTDTGLTPVLR